MGDNFCGLNRSGVTTLLQRYTRNTQLAYASFANDTNRKPFLVLLDHEKETVVIAVRGTLSLEDCVTDALCDPVEVLSMNVYCNNISREKIYYHNDSKYYYHAIVSNYWCVDDQNI